MTLTTAMIVSSLLGNLAIGASVAAFIPLVGTSRFPFVFLVLFSLTCAFASVTNAVRRVSGTGMLFIAAWIVADILNVAGLVVLGSQLTQKLLAGWYLAVDSVMFVQVRLVFSPFVSPSFLAVPLSLSPFLSARANFSLSLIFFVETAPHVRPL